MAEENHDDSIWLLGAQTTWVFEQSTGVSGKTFNPNVSFGPEASFGWSGTVSIFAAVTPWKGAFFLLEPEYANGHGMPNASGIAGYPNGEIVRSGVVGANPPPYIARALYRQEFALGPQTERPLSKFENRFFHTCDNSLAFTVGKFASNDFFDNSRVASDPRHRFLNWSLMDQGAWDYAADTRGYTYGLVFELDKPLFGLRTGIALMPKTANGPDLNWNLIDSQSGMLELEFRWRLGEQPGLIKTLGYINHANMGNYNQAIRSAATGAPPDITSVRSPSAIKYGGGVLIEQQIGSETLAFMRAGLNDGQTETYAFTEIDHSVSLGAHMTGAYWNRPEDRLALAFAANGLSNSHAAYLAAGGVGFQLGDGSLSYGWESILESYYLVSFGEHVEASADIQAIFNPGMNAGHGPTVVFGLRLHAH